MSLDQGTHSAVSTESPAAGAPPAAGTPLDGPRTHSSGNGSAVTGPSAISVIGARKYFGVTRALDGCNFHARLGEIHAIVGGNGCGKSTLAKVISGVLPLDSGQVQVLGHAASAPHEAREIGIATVFQEVLVADECTVVDNIFVGADRLFSATLSQAEKSRQAAAMMLDLTGEPIDVNDLVGTLPLGIKQWITIARALVTDPKVLILDESSAALDFDSTERLFAKMRELRDRGAAVLIVTHRIAELIRISDRATVMRDGRDVGVLERQDITERNLLALMTGEAQEKKEAGAVDAGVLEAPVVFRADDLTIWEDAEPMDFRLHRGEILGVAGLEGQGQSEFVRILAGVQHAHDGVAEVIGEDGGAQAVRSLEGAVDQGIVYVSGDRKKEGIFANLSIFENMLMPLYRSNRWGGKLGLINWQDLQGIFSWEVEKLMIKMGDQGDKITSLSGGNQQKMLIARGFAMKPDIIVLNDPARGIDVGAKSELYKHLRDFAASGKSVVYMSSELEEFIGFASRVIVFRHGTVFDEFIGSGIDPARILEAMFGQTAGLQKTPRRDRSVAARQDDAPARGLAIDTSEAARPVPVAAPVDNPLRAPREHIESPVRTAGPRNTVETIDKPPAPHVPNIKIREFGVDDRRDLPVFDAARPDRVSLSTDASPLRGLGSRRR